MDNYADYINSETCTSTAGGPTNFYTEVGLFLMPLKNSLRKRLVLYNCFCLLVCVYFQ